MPTLDQNTPQSYIPYLATGTGVFAGSGSPEGIQNGGIGSIYSDLLTGNLYTKTTAYATLTGWSLIGGGGGSGTVTSVGLSVPASLFVSPVTGSPVTTSGTLALALASQLQNLVFASPNGASGVPTFRALTSADLALAAPPPAGGVPYNDGANAFAAETGFLWDSATGTLQLGVAGTRSGRMQLRSLVSGSVTQTVGTPSGAHVIAWPDALPSANDLLRASAVAGSSVTLGWVAPSSLGFPTINATDGVIPYRSGSGAFSDSPIVRNGANDISIANSGAFAGLRITGNAAGSGVTLSSLSSGANEDIKVNPKGSGVLSVTTGVGTSTFSASVYALQLAGAIRDNSNFFLGSGGGFIGLLLGSDKPIKWSSTANWFDTVDAGLGRLGAGITRATNGGTGAGQFVVGSSAASTSNQFLVDSQSTTRVAGFFSMPASSSVATIKAETSSVQSFAFFPTGKIIGGMNSPTCNQQTAMIGNAKSDVSTIGNVGTGVDNLLSFVIQANALANTGDYAEFDAFGEFAPGVDNKTLKVVYGATTIFNTGATPFDGGNWRLNVKILRTGASAGKTIATFWNNGLVSPFLQEIFITTESFTANKTVQFAGEATTTDDITMLHLESKLVVALTS